ncbi:tetratricopeptide repeat protein [Rickettsiella endosymbiont of Miltochrista miniata]|uniref:tetratricopeptide repeat protein n=1 Tax=Rickettsiella endosymbiont of Miltochrista miniata TaxID=3066239 RepID=UPI00313D7BF3
MPKIFSTETYLNLLGYRSNISLGNCFHYGVNTEIDLKLARMYYVRALKTQKSSALHHLSLLANEEGNKGESFYFLGMKYEYIHEWERALTAYETAAKENYVPAMYFAGKVFKNDRLTNRGQLVFKKDITKELSWYRKAAVGYSAHALNDLVEMSEYESKAALHLAQMYEEGEIGNKKVITAALSYYEKAYELHNREAAYRLGRFYELGEEPVNKDLRKAFDYYLLAANQDCELGSEALSGLDRIVKILDDNLLSYKLAEIYQLNFKKNQPAFKCYQVLANKGDKTALKHMQQLADKNPDCAFELAKFNTVNNLTLEDPKPRYYYFGLAMHGYHNGAKKHLETLAGSGDIEAQYTLACTYYDLKFLDKSIIYFLLLTGQSYEPAIDFLKNKSFSKDHYFFIAESYENGNQNLLKNSDLAIFFYKKSFAEGSKEAAFRLGQLYSDSDVRIQFKKAREYFLKAHQLGHSEADCAFELAKLYEQNTQIKEHLHIAYGYYAKAMLNHHELSQEHLESIAKSGEVKVQYILAHTYYQQKKFDNAIHWGLKSAEQQYAPAIEFLKNQPFTNKYYLLIAETYEHGKEGIEKSKELALFFYEKGCEVGNKELAFHMGQLCQLPSETEGLIKDPNRACEYFIKAAQWGCVEAEITLNQLGAEIDPEMQLKLGNVFRNPPFNNQLKALHWYQQAIEGKNLDPKLELDKALTKMLDSIGVEFSFQEIIKLAQPESNRFSLIKHSIFRAEPMDIDDIYGTLASSIPSTSSIFQSIRN